MDDKITAEIIARIERLEEIVRDMYFRKYTGDLLAGELDHHVSARSNIYEPMIHRVDRLVEYLEATRQA